MKVAIVHYWLIDRRGGERVIEALCRLYPDADVFVNVYNEDVFGAVLSGHRVRTTFINRLPRAKTLYPAYLALMPFALEQLDLRGYDLVISSESGPAKGLIVAPEALHVCYCHSPMRYAWDLHAQYLADAGTLRGLVMRPLLHYLRAWDYLSAQRPDAIIANSEHTRRRIVKYWRREATVIHPPVDTHRFDRARSSARPGSYYLCAGQLVGYKRVDLAVHAFTRLGLPLVVAGVGPELARLQRQAGPNITFVGWTSDEVLADIIAGCRALVFPGEEDFGIVPVEAMAAGRPVIAFNRGGVLDTIVEGVTGLLFARQAPEDLMAAVRLLEEGKVSFDPDRIARHAMRFTRERFASQFTHFVEAHRGSPAAAPPIAGDSVR